MTLNPMRIQLSRERGWRMPEGAVKVDRTTRWGNPFRVEAFGYPTHLTAGCNEAKHWRHRKAVASFLRMLENETRAYPSLDEIRRDLHGRSLACWCPLDAPCHADVLLEIANRCPN